MPTLCHGTLKSSPDKNGNRHRLSIDALSSKKCTCVTRYIGQVFSYSKTRDPRDRDLVIVKFPKSDSSEAWAETELKKASLAGEVAVQFNEHVWQVMAAASGGGVLRETELKFVQPQTASLVSTSFADRKRKKGDSMIFEDILDDFTVFVNVKGESLPKSRRRRTSSKGETPSFPQGRARSRPILIPAARRRCEPTAPPSDPDSDSPPSYEESNRLENERRERRELERMLCEYLETRTHSQQTGSSGQTCADAEVLAAAFVDSVEQRLAQLCLHPASAGNPGDNSNRVSQTSIDHPDVDDSDVTNPFLQAFVHFFFCQTRGQAVVCGLKGSREEGGYALTTPVLHSLAKEYGHRDGGEAAMREVIANHRCSKLCRQLPDMLSVLRNADREGRHSLSAL